MRLLLRGRVAVVAASGLVGLLIVVAGATGARAQTATPGGLATPTPGGDCCSAHGGSNCDNGNCSDCVCNTGSPPDPVCCAPDHSWDSFCVADAQRCGDVCSCNQTPVPTPTPGGPCCDTHEGSGCDIGACQACVCNGVAPNQPDPHCCGTGFTCSPDGPCWDADCVAEALSDACQSACGCAPQTPTPTPAGGGSCCGAHDGANCDDSACQACVCGEDPHCCGLDSQNNPITCSPDAPCWDADCVSEATIDCSDSCPCPSSQDCCTAQADPNNPIPGCNDEPCKDCVCHTEYNDVSCCTASSGWDQDCVAEVNDACAASCSCIAKETCCDEHAADQSAGCQDNTCESCVCTLDPFCCNQDGVCANKVCTAGTVGAACDVNADCNSGGFWDGSCAQEAADPTLCGERCTGCVDCCTAQPSAPGCSHTACQDCVCGTGPGQVGDTACCDGVWDQFCVDDANNPDFDCASICACGPSTRPTPTPSCPGDCTGQGTVTISDLIVCVNIALGSADPSTCLSVDTDNNGQVSISELIQAVNAALNGCPSS